MAVFNLHIKEQTLLHLSHFLFLLCKNRKLKICINWISLHVCVMGSAHWVTSYLDFILKSLTLFVISDLLPALLCFLSVWLPAPPLMCYTCLPFPFLVVYCLSLPLCLCQIVFVSVQVITHPFSFVWLFVISGFWLFFVCLCLCAAFVSCCLINLVWATHLGLLCVW